MNDMTERQRKKAREQFDRRWRYGIVPEWNLSRTQNGMTQSRRVAE